MESRRRQKWDNYKRSQNRRPPRGTCSWQPTVPSWEKEFCRVVGSLDWETVLQMKKFTHLYENVIKWNDSAGEDAFSNAKKRFWAEINGLPYDGSVPNPDPDLYIDKIDWNTEIAPELLSELESKPMTSNEQESHDPVVIFGDSLLPKQTYSPVGWGDEYDEENFKAPPNCSPLNCGDGPWEQNRVDSFDNGPPIEWSGYGSGPNNDGGWNNANNDMIFHVGPNIEHEAADGEYTRSRFQGNPRYRNNIPRNDNGRPKATYWGQQEKRHSSREWSSFNPGHRAAITVGQTWNR